jgi:acetyl-CoA carboxylase biotin carboxyl carrier protein
MAAKRTRPAKKKTSKPAKPRKSPKAPTSSRRSAGARPAKASAEDKRVAEIQRIIDVMVRSGAVEVEMEDASSRLRVRLKEDPPAIVTASHAPMAQPMATSPDVPGASLAQPAAPVEEGEEFLSPMVGSYYRASSPEAEPFIQVGDSFSEETTLCIIEAMKVMNEIKAEMRGRIVAILVENGEPVEFGQPLFRIQKG